MLKLQRNRTKPELTRILFVTSLDLADSTITKKAAFAQSNKSTFRSKESKIIAWEVIIEWEHFFRTFLTRRKNDVGSSLPRSSGPSWANCTLSRFLLCFALFCSSGSSLFLAQTFQMVLIKFSFTTVFVDTRLWKTKHSRKRFQTFRQSYVLSTCRIQIHQSQPLVWPSDLLYVMLGGCDWWISIRHVDNTCDWRQLWKRFRECVVFQSRVSTKTVVMFLSLLLSHRSFFIFPGFGPIFVVISPSLSFEDV